MATKPAKPADKLGDWVQYLISSDIGSKFQGSPEDSLTGFMYAGRRFIKEETATAKIIDGCLSEQTDLEALPLGKSSIQPLEKFDVRPRRNGTLGKGVIIDPKLMMTLGYAVFPLGGESKVKFRVLPIGIENLGGAKGGKVTLSVVITSPPKNTEGPQDRLTRPTAQEELEIIETINREFKTLPFPTIDALTVYVCNEYSWTEYIKYMQLQKMAGLEDIA